MSSAGSIAIDVVADVTKLVAGMTKAEKVVSKTTKAMGSMVKGFAVAFISGATINGINNTINSLDALNKTAGKLGTTTEELSSLGYAAERAGVSSRTFEMAMQRMTRRAAEAAAGTGEAAGAIKELGIEATSFNDLSLEDKMAMLADAFQGVASESDQLRIAFKLFDSEGAALVNMLKNGSTELKKFQAQSDAVGNTVKQSLADQASKAADSITNFNAATTAMTNNLMTVFLPTLNKAFFALMDFFDIPRMKGLEELTNQASNLKDEIAALEKQIKDPTMLQKFLNQSVAGTDWYIATEELKKIEAQIAALQLQTENKPLFNPTFNQSGAEFTKILDALITKLDPFGTQVKQYYTDLSLLNDAFERGRITGDQYDSMLNNLNSSMPGVNSETKDLKQNLDAANSAANTFGTGMTSAFRQAMDGATNFKDLFANVAKDIVANLIHILVVQQAVNAAMGAMGFSTGGTTGGTVAVAGMAASGGVTKKGGSYLVGENGPEIVTLPGNTNVTANSDMGSSVNVTVINNANAQVQTQQDGNDITILIEQVSASIANGISRNTSPVADAIQSSYGLSR